MPILAVVGIIASLVGGGLLTLYLAKTREASAAIDAYGTVYNAVFESQVAAGVPVEVAQNVAKEASNNAGKVAAITKSSFFDFGGVGGVAIPLALGGVVYFLIKRKK